MAYFVLENWKNKRTMSKMTIFGKTNCNYDVAMAMSISWTQNVHIKIFAKMNEQLLKVSGP